MPIYEFRCEACGKIAEFHMKLSDPYPTDCPTCSQPQLKKIMSLPSFQLKGGGWYSDAYDGKSNKRSTPSASEGGESKSSDSSSAAASPAKSESPASSPAPSPSKPKTD